MILKKHPILKSYAIKQPNLNNNEVNAVSTVTELVAEPISIMSESSPNSKVNVDAKVKAINTEDNVCDDDDYVEIDTSTNIPPVKQVTSPIVSPPVKPTFANISPKKQLQRIILFKESKLIKLNK